MHDVKVARLSQLPSSSALRLLAASVFVVAAATAALPARAQSHHGPAAGEAHSPAPMTMTTTMMFGGPPEHIARSIDHLLDGPNATDAQRVQIKQIATTAAADLRAQREAGRGLRGQGLQLFTAPTVDAGAAEALRQQMSAQHEQASKRSLQAMLDVARVLTPEQRARIGARMADRRAVSRERMQRMQHPSPHAHSGEHAGEHAGGHSVEPAAREPAKP